jgi:hypothetical protein
MLRFRVGSVLLQHHFMGKRSQCDQLVERRKNMLDNAFHGWVRATFISDPPQVLDDFRNSEFARRMPVSIECQYVQGGVSMTAS